VAPIALALHLIINTKPLQFFACGLATVTAYAKGESQETSKAREVPEQGGHL
jgi:hypothetical protein